MRWRSMRKEKSGLRQILPTLKWRFQCLHGSEEACCLQGTLMSPLPRLLLLAFLRSHGLRRGLLIFRRSAANKTASLNCNTPAVNSSFSLLA